MYSEQPPLSCRWALSLMAVAKWKGFTFPYVTERVITFLSVYLLQTLSVSHQTETKTSEDQKLPPDTKREAKAHLAQISSESWCVASQVHCHRTVTESLTETGESEGDRFRGTTLNPVLCVISNICTETYPFREDD